GHCYRLWTRGEEGSLAPYPPAEIEAADLTGLALELALWGGAEGLAFLTPPNPGVMAEAQALLHSLGALDGGGRITDHGRALAALPLHPRLGHMLLRAEGQPQAALLAALLAERDPLRGAPPDLSLRLAALQDTARLEANHPYTADRATLARIRDEARRLSRALPARAAAKSRPAATGPVSTGPAVTGPAPTSPTAPAATDAQLSPAQLAALAYPDRVALRRKGDAPRFILSGGKGAVMDPGTPLAGYRLLVATDLDGDPREARIRQAAPITESELRTLYAPEIRWQDRCEWSRREGRILARRQECFGALVLDDRIWPDAPPEAMARAALQGLHLLGLPWTPAAQRLRARALLCRQGGADLPDMSDTALLAHAEDWLLPYLTKIRTEADLKRLDLTDPLRAYLGYAATALLDRLTPSHFETPLGRRIPIDYDGDAPGIELRLQELFGT
ncbi:MAG: ATP-dependent helicase C-terminal domain-containing protein, partial [Hydrogenophaga sp.]|nr:ATP-dependent helicase C-terminal domain-containing protein [Hydrogenophaga sp.]